jgi:hypothetical protein
MPRRKTITWALGNGNLLLSFALLLAFMLLALT